MLVALRPSKEKSWWSAFLLRTLKYRACPTGAQFPGFWDGKCLQGFTVQGHQWAATPAQSLPQRLLELSPKQLWQPALPYPKQLPRGTDYLAQFSFDGYSSCTIRNFVGCFTPQFPNFPSTFVDLTYPFAPFCGGQNLLISSKGSHFLQLVKYDP